jgi:ADP-ribose pyrophosphatase
VLIGSPLRERHTVARSEEEGWKLVDSKIVFNSPYVTAYQNAYETASGTLVDDYFVLERSDFVLVVAQCSSHLLLVRQYRPAVDRFFWAVPAGYVEGGESPDQAATRELREETGYSATNEAVVGELRPLPGYVRSRAFVVLCDLDQKHEDPDDTEGISTIRQVPWDEAVSMVVTGEIDEMQSAAAILLARESLGRKRI